MLKKPPVPTIIPNGDGMIDTSKFSRLAILEVFERIGGIDRLETVADENPKWFYEKMFGKTIQPEKIEVAREKSIAELLAELDQKMIDVTPRVSDAEVGD